MLQEIHRCIACQQEFRDNEELMAHQCGKADAIDKPPQTMQSLATDMWNRRHVLTTSEWLEAGPLLLGMVVAKLSEGGGDAALAIGEDAFRAGWAAHAAMVSLAASGDRSSLPEAIITVEQA